MSPANKGKPVAESKVELSESELRIEARCHLGERLSQARQVKDIGIHEASEQLRIRQHYLEALESGDWKTLPEEVYVMGFLRQYANLLGVDLGEDIEALKTGEYTLTKPFTMPDPPIAMNRAWAVAAGACFLILLILFNVVDEGEEELHPARLQMANPVLAPAPATIELQAEDATVSELPAQAEETSVQSDALLAEETVKAASDAESSPAEPAATQEPVIIPSPTVAKQAETENTRQMTSALTSTDGSGRHVFLLTAVDEDVWLQLHKPDGTLAKEALLRSGQGMRLKTDEDYLLLTSGNPLALSITINGLSVAEPGALGEKDKVLHDHRLLSSAAPSEDIN